MSFNLTIDADAELDVAFDWNAPVSPQNPKGPWLAAGETISSHVIVATDGITAYADTETDGVVTVWVKDATAPVQRVTCRITTDQGRTDDRTIKFTVLPR